RLRAGIADGRAAIGLAATLEALDERRLETLLYEAGFAAAGVRCERCGRLGTDDGAASCPACGGELRRRESILEEAITAALLQSATVESIAGRPDLGPLGRIAALLRF
ncbi:MAG TPA: zinc ribbon domain-containing protein, partial [Solirubrobacteraceae bacterium]|nr:zinc ribbon domain-containing protein [Solirubrobacteraceae bacterium]